jgi:hypothetical protein
VFVFGRNFSIIEEHAIIFFILKINPKSIAREQISSHPTISHIPIA